MYRHVELPVPRPLYATYHYQAGVGAVAATNPTHENWYLSNCLVLQGGRRFLGGFTSPEIEVRHTRMWDIPYVERLTIPLKFTWDSHDKIIKRILREGYYAYFSGVDDYYVEGKSWYQERHFLHDGLLCGFDEEAKTYSVYAYDQRWICRVFRTPTAAFTRGLRAAVESSVFGTLIALKAEERKIELDLGAVRANLEEHLDSDMTKYPPDIPRTAYGLVVYEYIGQYLDRLGSGDTPYDRIDHRVFRQVWEHKCCLLKSIRAVEAALGLPADISEAYAPLVQTANELRMLYARYTMQHDDRLLGTLKHTLLQTKEREAVILHRLLTVLTAATTKEEC